MWYLYIPALLLTAYAAYTDVKRKEIDNWVSIAILSYGILIDGILYRQKFVESFVFMILIFAVLITIYYITPESLGGGDIKILTALAFVYGHNIIPLIFIAGMINLVYGLIKGIKEKTYLKTKTIFAPAIFAGTIATTFIGRF
ncbi:prepilin peptidase [Aceticella autotrophica]|uniref:Prepilin peptidase n=1 Tax=Aceticella autotrophica TaxID=2755338 RepID=A0A975AWD1_9THEO|nr:A24 family peptidase [Aceticella autotrophica]QSZ27606.1 prepilin peptidase [Aceticella autotrophica]